ncbi:MAG TPA: TonB family protein [Niastella sp.]
MKPTAVLVAVMLLPGGILSVGCSYNTEKKAGTATIVNEPILPEASLKEEKAAPLPKPDQKEVTSQKAVKLKPVKRLTGTIEGKRETTQFDVLPTLPAEDDSDSIIMTKVEIEAEYPGGAAAWQRFLNRNLRYPQEAIDNDELSGSILVQFVVDEEGNVSNVEKVSGPEALGAEAVRVIKKSGKWTPAVQGGRYVRSLKKQPFMICFR